MTIIMMMIIIIRIMIVIIVFFFKKKKNDNRNSTNNNIVLIVIIISIIIIIVIIVVTIINLRSDMYASLRYHCEIAVPPSMPQKPKKTPASGAHHPRIRKCSCPSAFVCLLM